MTRSCVQYSTLRGEPESCRTSSEELEVRTDDSTTHAKLSQIPTQVSRYHTHMYTWAVAICMVCTMLNAMFLASTFRSDHSLLAPSVTSIPRKDIWKLRRPNQYIGLDEIERPTPPLPKQFDNFPIAVAQVDSLDVGRVIENGLKTHMGASGSYVPDDKQVVVTERVSTIVEFLAVDFGMEQCELQLTIDSSSIMNASPTPFMLDVFRLNSTIPINSDTLSYNTRPARISKVAALEMQSTDVRWHRSFHCSTDEYLAFELACTPSLGEISKGGHLFKT
ncbi:hypothetical protein EVJ58_g7916 [Rhodofomes roseus]|uniref:Ubiquitin 3 binding protein But2 C-terminal domain-containing protein n=1 Tax=Rhodofomes roseus TaxID=34475 RepID=A0A4Y9Y0V0_9APHY|nr:hypothetical protein EVJ58_g7916 [Rhodofomes roseus]